MIFRNGAMVTVHAHLGRDGEWIDPYGGIFSAKEIADFEDMAPTLEISDDDGEEPFETSLPEFLRDNADTISEEDFRQLVGLKYGEAIEFGGGAAPIVRVKRTG